MVNAYKKEINKEKRKISKGNLKICFKNIIANKAV